MGTVNRQKVKNMAALKALTGMVVDNVVETDGYITEGDGGHGTYKCVATSSGSYIDDGGKTIILNDTDTVFQLQQIKKIYVEQYGIVNESTDYVTHYIKALAAYDTVSQRGTHRWQCAVGPQSNIQMRSNQTVEYLKMTVGYYFVAFFIPNNTDNLTIRYNDIKWGTTNGKEIIATNLNTERSNNITNIFIYNNKIHSNKRATHGVRLTGVTNFVINHNEINEQRGGSGIDLDYCHQGTVNNNRVHDSGRAGIKLYRYNERIECKHNYVKGTFLMWDTCFSCGDGCIDLYGPDNNDITIQHNYMETGDRLTKGFFDSVVDAGTSDLDVITEFYTGTTYTFTIQSWVGGTPTQYQFNYVHTSDTTYITDIDALLSTANVSFGASGVTTKTHDFTMTGMDNGTGSAWSIVVRTTYNWATGFRAGGSQRALVENNFVLINHPVVQTQNNSLFGGYICTVGGRVTNETHETTVIVRNNYFKVERHPDLVGSIGVDLVRSFTTGDAPADGSPLIVLDNNTWDLDDGFSYRCIVVAHENSVHFTNNRMTRPTNFILIPTNIDPMGDELIVTGNVFKSTATTPFISPGFNSNNLKMVVNNNDFQMTTTSHSIGIIEAVDDYASLEFKGNKITGRFTHCLDLRGNDTVKHNNFYTTADSGQINVIKVSGENCEIQSNNIIGDIYAIRIESTAKNFRIFNNRLESGSSQIRIVSDVPGEIWSNTYVGGSNKILADVSLTKINWKHENLIISNSSQIENVVGERMSQNNIVKTTDKEEWLLGVADKLMSSFGSATSLTKGELVAGDNFIWQTNPSNLAERYTYRVDADFGPLDYINDLDASMVIFRANTTEVSLIGFKSFYRVSKSRWHGRPWNKLLTFESVEHLRLARNVSVDIRPMVIAGNSQGRIYRRVAVGSYIDDGDQVLVSYDGVNAWLATTGALNKTGNSLVMNNKDINYYNMALTDTKDSATYTVSNLITGGAAVCLIKTISAAPVVTGATLIFGSDWVTNIEMEMIVKYNGIIAQYYFLKI